MKTWHRLLLSFPLSLMVWESVFLPTVAAPPRKPDRKVECDMLVVGGGLAGSATAYEGLLAGKTVCMTEITDWVGGQISAQGTSALDERPTQRSLLFYPRGYLELRERIKKKYDTLNPGDCWVSDSCFLPQDGHELLFQQLQAAANKGRGKLRWYPTTVIKEFDIEERQIKSAIAIQHQPQPGTKPLNTKTLSQTIEDAYRYEDSPSFQKTIIQFVPKSSRKPAPWYVIEATETGEIIALADVPFRVGVDRRSYLEPSSSSATGDPFCTQGFTYTFAMEATQDPQDHQKPEFYSRYEPYYSYELKRLADFDLVFTYRRIWSPQPGAMKEFGNVSFTVPTPGDISMQNWTWGNDYRPGTEQDNLVYTREQLRRMGQLAPGFWMGGLRTESLRRAEENAIGFFYWLVAGETDSQLGPGVKQPHPNNRFLSGFDSPMGTAHGLSKYPYIRESRRIIGRRGYGYDDGFTISEVDISRVDYSRQYYQENLSEQTNKTLSRALAGEEVVSAITTDAAPSETSRRSRARIYPDSVGIGHYAIDFHPCMTEPSPEAPGNRERKGERIGAGQAYPFQIPLRAMIPQTIDNLLVAGKGIAASHIAAAAYRVHSFEWSVGAAAGMTAAFALENEILPYQLVDDLPRAEPELRLLQQRLKKSGNPNAFPNTSLFDTYEDWR